MLLIRVLLINYTGCIDCMQGKSEAFSVLSLCDHPAAVGEAEVEKAEGTTAAERSLASDSSSMASPLSREIL